MIVWDVVIIGGGAAGLMCAIEAGKRRRRVLILEHSNRVGKKILMSGGGRCNFTNLHVTPDNFLSANPHFCKSALARYSPWDFMALVERHGIAYHEKELGQLFCDQSSKLIVKMLVAECQQAGVQIDVGCKITMVQKTAAGFALETSLGPIQTTALVVASGGLSIPKMGATGFGYELAKRFGHRIRATRPALVPLTLNGETLAQYRDLSGIGLLVEASCHNRCFPGGLLFTHRGISGPAILQISSYWQPSDELQVNLLPGIEVSAWLTDRQHNRPDAELRTVLTEKLPKRLAQRLCELAFDNLPLRQYPPQELQAMAKQLQHWRFHPQGTEGYRTAEVTLGGVNTDELSSATMASKKVPGLYFIGEVVDVTGHLGGFNFQWAWASGHAAGQVV
ncbi:HI0933 family protein [Nitrosococcus halophilus Nc 4]|uniref:HI0933 family protein n=1 Tax=Nitrosococcus halophilus (strain Nc4) TaxID=472759 RepID=D5BUV0_NITHN|nr:NAD(P)/FAD-dependent oxidoreductase [Nitrosococcus halophilus]ADE13500.1 HI0933 family protein [Nitrosococcus halophilus Nc 4]